MAYITKGIGGFYYVKTPDGVVECKARGIFRKRGITPVAGDNVTLSDDGTMIYEILPRKNVFIRPPIANLDILFIVTSTTQPVPSTLVLDQLAAAAIYKDVQPVLVVTKSDLAAADMLRTAYAGSGIPLVQLNYETGEGLDEVKGYIEGHLCAFCGNSGVGKSSLLNQILGEERVIVSNVAGTTRDAIDSYFENESGKFLFIDTAGMRRKSKVDDAVEKYSNLRSIAAIERADVCLILIDANEGVTEQDTKVAGLAHEAGKACIIVVNKWDTVEKDTNTMDEKTAEIRRDLSYMTYAPVVFISALTGQRVDKLFDMIVAVSNQNSMRITTGMLNNILEDATARVQPPTDKGRRLRIFYMTQASTCPPTFVCFCNDARLFHFSYQRYLENQIRAVFGLTGTPIKITIRQKGDKEDV